MIAYILLFIFFFFNDTATTEIYTLSLHDALPIYSKASLEHIQERGIAAVQMFQRTFDRLAFSCSEAPLHSNQCQQDRKSTRLNSSHANISYAVFCLKKKKKTLVHLLPMEYN